MPADKCPNCRTEVSQPNSASVSTWPFCSERCRMADLDRWFTEEYRVPGKHLDEADESGLDAVG